MTVDGVVYDIDWRKFTKGKALFFPCLDPQKAKREVRAAMKQMKLKVVYRVEIDPIYRIRGLRVWRV